MGLRLALTFLVPALVVWLMPRVPLPRLDWDQIERTLGPYAAEATLSVFALGLGPIVSSFLLVELAALCVPRWRPLRTGPSGRARLLLTASRLAAVIAGIQAVGVAVYLERVGLLEPVAGLSRLAVVLSLVAGVAFLAAVAEGLDRAAFGGGFSLLATALAVAAEGPSLAALVHTPVAATPFVIVFIVIAVVLRGRVSDAPGWRPALPLPACGLLPLVWSTTIVSFMGQRLASAVGLTLTAGFAVGFGFLFNRPRLAGC